MFTIFRVYLASIWAHVYLFADNVQQLDVHKLFSGIPLLLISAATLGLIVLPIALGIFVILKSLKMKYLPFCNVNWLWRLFWDIPAIIFRRLFFGESSKGTRLQRYVAARNIEGIRELLSNYPIEFRERGNNHGITPLHIACDSGLVEIVQLLLKDARPEYPELKGGYSDHNKYVFKTSLQVAVESCYSDQDAVIGLLLANSRPELRQIRTESGGTVLHLASRVAPDIIRLMLKDMPDSYRTITDENGQTALHVFALDGAHENIVPLMESADPSFRDMKDNEGRTAMLYGLLREDTKVIAALLNVSEERSHSVCDKFWESLVSQCDKHDPIELEDAVENLRQIYGVHLSLEAFTCRAAATGSVKLLSTLLKKLHGQYRAHKYSPVHSAARSENMECLEFLLNHPRYPFKEFVLWTHSNELPIHIGAEYGCLKSVKMLIKHAYKSGKGIVDYLESQNQDDLTPFQLAWTNGHLKVCHEILKALQPLELPKYIKMLKFMDADALEEVKQHFINDFSKTFIRILGKLNWTELRNKRTVTLGDFDVYVERTSPWETNKSGFLLVIQQLFVSQYSRLLYLLDSEVTFGDDLEASGCDEREVPFVYPDTIIKASTNWLGDATCLFDESRD
eukprot:TRINITY_DN28764_c0_g2_i1.p1 TRINITY_DN28764_c0_g2~~TRINITY_DN28764_c0_g2_i1.p1  ORF type:complete len:624 (+),score=74.80 TRINITY_DN28764_c0_g2_i1:110-1981(+)